MFVTSISDLCRTKKSLLMRNRWIVACLAGLMVLPVSAGEQKEKQEKEDTKKGEAIITVFSDFHSGFGTANNDRGFDLDRAYIGYQYSLPHGLQLKAVMDFGQSDHVEDYQRIGYVKNAMVSWKHGKWTLNGGLITTTQFKTQEDFWGKRYIMKSFQDQYKFGSSADLAISAAYKFNQCVSADVILANGEGYKRVQVKNGLQYGAGVTLKPAEGLVVRVYGSYNEAAEDGQKGITNLAAFAGYKHKAFSVAAEYNYQTNASYVDNQDQSGVSAYATIRCNKNIALFGRWDYLMSKADWNLDDDGMAGVAGAEFKIGKYIKLAPNFRIWSPKQSGAKNECYAYLNASFSL